MEQAIGPLIPIGLQQLVDAQTTEHRSPQRKPQQKARRNAKKTQMRLQTGDLRIVLKNIFLKVGPTTASMYSV